MEVIIQRTSRSASAYAGRLVSRLLKEKPAAVLGLATGETPLALYREVIALHQEEGLDFSNVTTFNLDEYLGLDPGHPASYHFFMQEHLFRHINVPSSRVHIPDGLAKNVPAFCEGYEKAIRDAGGIDLQVLGIGTDGHIGFNEPGSSLASRTRIKTLTSRTREDNARFFQNIEEVPHHVITMGVGTIMDARHIVLLAFGERKAASVAAAVEGPITAMVPASILQMHPRVTFLMDEASASQLKRADYYRWVFEQKPEWQQP
jgi:glucosamine-6-phosphate deaminase